jgi:hypothetical protein
MDMTKIATLEDAVSIAALAHLAKKVKRARLQ